MAVVIICIIGIIFFAYRYKKKKQEEENLPPQPPTPVIEPPDKCPHCGEKVTEDTVYCESCGRLVKEEAPVELQEKKLFGDCICRFERIREIPRESGEDLTDAVYKINKKSYTGIQFRGANEWETLNADEYQIPGSKYRADDVKRARDDYGNPVIGFFKDIPAFDSGDRIWDTCRATYIIAMPNGIYMAAARYGYRVAEIEVYEKLVEADARLEKLFKKLGLPTEKIRFVTE